MQNMTVVRVVAVEAGENFIDRRPRVTIKVPTADVAHSTLRFPVSAAFGLNSIPALGDEYMLEIHPCAVPCDDIDSPEARGEAAARCILSGSAIAQER